MMARIKKIPALGTLWWFDIFGILPGKIDKELTEFFTEYLTSFEQKYSRFLDTSLVGTLNRTGVLENPSDEFIALLELGQGLYRETKGAFNFLSAQTQVSRGYGKPEAVQSDGDPSPANPETDISISKKQIKLHRGAVDLGGFGKGWLIDDLAHTLKTNLKAEHFLINGGGDIYATTLPDGSPIDILIEHPTKKNHCVAKIPLANCGFASSSTYKRRWKKTDKEHHHIIAKHDYNVATHIISHTALHADVFATLACIAPPHGVARSLNKAGVEYLIIFETGAFACSDFFQQRLMYHNMAVNSAKNNDNNKK